MAICVVRFDGSPSITGWYWGCMCNECRERVKQVFFGPYKTGRRAEKAGLKGDASAASLCIEGVLEAEGYGHGRVSAKSAELAHMVRLENAETEGASH
jgi:hypothetical protein